MMLLAAAAAIVSGMPQPAEGVRLRARPEVGQTYRYDVRADFSFTRGADPASQSLEQEVRIRFTVAQVDEEGTATVRAAFESINASVRPLDGGPASTFQWRADEAPAAAGDKDALKNAGPLYPMYRELAGSFLQFRVASDGTLADVEGLDGVLQAGRQSKLPGPERALGVLLPEAARTHLAVIWALDPGSAARSPGATWTTGRPIPIMPGYTAGREVRWTLGSVTDGVAELAGPIVVSLSTDRKPASEAEPTLAITDQSGAATARWDTRAGRLVSATTESRLDWSASLKLKEPIVTTRSTAAKVRITLVEEPAAR